MEGNNLLDDINDLGIKIRLCEKHPQGWSVLKEDYELYRFQPGPEEHPEHKYFSDFRGKGMDKWSEKHQEIREAARQKHGLEPLRKPQAPLSKKDKRRLKIESRKFSPSDQGSNNVTSDEIRAMHLNFDKKYPDGWTMHRNGQVIGHYQPGPELLPNHKHIQDYRDYRFRSETTSKSFQTPLPNDPNQQTKGAMRAGESAKPKRVLRKKVKKDPTVSLEWTVPNKIDEYDIDKVLEELEEVDIKDKVKCKSRCKRSK